MKKLLITAAALAVAVSTGSYLAGQAQAAPAKSPFCNMAKASNNGYAADVSWAAYYGCWGTAGMTAPTRVIQVEGGPPSADFCKMPKASNNGYAADVSWASYYHCWGARR